MLYATLHTEPLPIRPVKGLLTLSTTLGGLLSNVPPATLLPLVLRFLFFVQAISIYGVW